MTDQQAEIGNIVAQEDADIAALATEIKAELDAIAAQHPSLDLSGLHAVADKLDALTTANAAPVEPAPSSSSSSASDAAPSGLGDAPSSPAPS